MNRKLTKTIVTRLANGCLVLLFMPCVAIADEAGSDYTIGAGFEFYHGNYGSDVSTDIFSFQPAMEYSFTEDLRAMLMIPFLYQSNNATVPIGGGHFPMPRSGPGPDPETGGTGYMGHDGGGMGPPGGGHPPDHPSPPEFSDEPISGPGDVLLAVSYWLLDEKEKSPSISSELYVKFPTADDDKGLGTGAYDYGLGLSFGKWLASWKLDAQVLYIMPGSTPSFELLNYWDWSVSSNYLFTEHLSLGLGLSGATNPFAGTDDLLEFELQGSYWVSSRVGIWTVVSFGLSDNSADYGVGVYGVVSF